MCMIRTLSLLVPFFFMASLHSDPLEDSIGVRVGEVFKGTYFALGDTIDIAGTIEGDAYLIGTHIEIHGTIQGKLVAVAGSIDLSGKVEGNVWALAGSGEILGEVSGDLLFLSASTKISSPAEIGKDIVVCAGNVELGGSIQGDATILASNLEIKGNIAHNLRSFVGKMQIGKHAEIAGNLKYRSDQLAVIDPKAKIQGEIFYEQSILHDFIDTSMLQGIIIGSKVAALLMNFLYTFVIGFVLLRLFPRKVKRTLEALETLPLKSLGYGVALLVVLPLTSIVLLVTVIGAPFALTLIALNIISFYTAKIFVILWGTNWVFSRFQWRKNTLKVLAVGQVLYFLLTTIPVLGPCLVIFCLLFGLGGAVLAQTRS